MYDRETGEIKEKGQKDMGNGKVDLKTHWEIGRST